MARQTIERIGYNTYKFNDKICSIITSLKEQSKDFRRLGILKKFGRRKLPSGDEEGFFRKLAAYGHVGRTDFDLPWEITDKADALI